MKPATLAYKRRYPNHLLEVIDWAMEVDPLLRPQDAGSMLEALTQETGRPDSDLQKLDGNSEGRKWENEA